VLKQRIRERLAACRVQDTLPSISRHYDMCSDSSWCVSCVPQEGLTY